LNIHLRYEVDLERQPGSVWCVCVQILSAHHVHSDEDFYSQSTRSFECVFDAFGDKTRLIGEVVEADGGEGGEVKFTSNETKFLFSSSVSALENMFESMGPVALKFKPLEDNPERDIPQYARTLALAGGPARRQSLKRARKQSALSSTHDLLANKSSTGQVIFQNLHKDRYNATAIK
jgi:hypothetical protein